MPPLKKTIPLLNLKKEYRALKAELDKAIYNSLATANYILGPEVEELEKKLAEYLGVQRTVGVASGTDALVIALRALAIRAGKEYFHSEDEVITTPFTFTATGGAILRSGAKPVFVDIEEDSFNLDVEKVEKAITRHTVGIIPVHLYGLCCEMEGFGKLARQHLLFLLEDVAQAFGATYRGKKAGSFGEVAALSFFPSKNLGCFGDGGLIASGNEELAELCRMLRTHGGKDKYDVEYLGYNSRLDTIQAAVLLVKLQEIERLNSLRRKIAATYNEGLKDLSWLKTPVEIENGRHIYHQYTVRIEGGRRDWVQDRLQEKGIASAVYYPVPLHRMKLFADRAEVRGDLVHTEQACREVLSLPVEPLMDAEEVAYVIEALRGLKI